MIYTELMHCSEINPYLIILRIKFYRKRPNVMKFENLFQSPGELHSLDM